MSLRVRKFTGDKMAASAALSGYPAFSPEASPLQGRYPWLSVCLSLSGRSIVAGALPMGKSEVLSLRRGHQNDGNQKDDT